MELVEVADSVGVGGGGAESSDRIESVSSSSSSSASSGTTAADGESNSVTAATATTTTTTAHAATATAATTVAAVLAEPKKRAYQTRQLDYKQKKAICLKKQSSPGITQEALRLWAQAEFTLLKPPGQSTISDILKNADAILALDARALENKRVRSVTYPELDTALANWVLQCEARGVKIYNDLIKAQAAVLCELLGIAPNAIRFSGGWLESFKDRHGFNAFTVFGRAAKHSSASTSAAAGTKALALDSISPGAGAGAMLAEPSPSPSSSVLAMLPTSASASASASALGQGHATVEPPSSENTHSLAGDRLEAIRERAAAYAPHDVYAMQETALVYRLEPDTSKKPRARLTVVLCTNADGSARREPLVIGTDRQPASFGDKPAAAAHYGVAYRSNKRAWMTGLLFRDWIIRFNSSMLAAGRRVLLLLNPATSHVVTGLELANVDVQFLPAAASSASSASSTAPLHPLDAGVVRAFKLKYRALLLQHALEQAEEVQRWAAPESFRRPLKAANIFYISQLTAMRWLSSAWKDVSDDTVAHCFQLQRLVTVARAKPRQSLQQIERELEASLLYRIDYLRVHDPLVDAAVLAAEDDERASAVHQTFNPEDFVDRLTPEEEEAAAAAAVAHAHAADDSASVLDSYSTAEKLDRVRTVILMLNDFAGADEHAIATLRSLQTHLRGQTSFDVI